MVWPAVVFAGALRVKWSATKGRRVLIHRSRPPKPPGRVEVKNIVLPSADSAGAPASNPTTLIGAPRFMGVDHGSSVLARVETQMSKVPIPPGRFDPKRISRPSLRMAGRVSLYG